MTASARNASPQAHPRLTYLDISTSHLPNSEIFSSSKSKLIGTNWTEKPPYLRTAAIGYPNPSGNVMVETSGPVRTPSIRLPTLLSQFTPYSCRRAPETNSCLIPKPAHPTVSRSNRHCLSWINRMSTQPFSHRIGIQWTTIASENFHLHLVS